MSNRHAEGIVERRSNGHYENGQRINNGTRKIKSKLYNKELKRLQVELVKLQEWIKHRSLKVIILFEGRDAAGKGGTIKRVNQRMNPRICPSVKKRNGISSGTRPICRRRERWCSLTAVGTTGQGSNE